MLFKKKKSIPEEIIHMDIPVRRHGYWIVTRGDINNPRRGGDVKCSVCGKVLTFQNSFFQFYFGEYCRHCGAVMDGVDNDLNDLNKNYVLP